MGIQGLIEFIERNCPQACVPVDLQKIGRGRKRSKTGENPFYLVIDADSCLHRLYGGSFSDWVCGGQWNYMFQFIDNLARACRSSNIHLVVYFNGCLEKPRMQEWIKQQNNSRQTVHQILSHVHSKNTPPPRMWFVPPVALETFIRLALLQCGISVTTSVGDHMQEVMSHCRDYGYHGIIAQNSEYCIFDPPKMFSSHQMKLTRSGNLLTTQYQMDEVAKELDLNPNRMVVFAALIGNHIVPDEDLALFHWFLLGPGHPLAGLKQARTHQLVMPPTDTVIRAVASYVRNLPSVDDLDAIARDVFQNSQFSLEDKITRFKQSVNYYYAGTRQSWKQRRNARPPMVVFTPGGVYYRDPEETGYRDPAENQGWQPPFSEITGANAMGVQPQQQQPAQTQQQLPSAPQIVVQPPEQTQANLESAFESEMKAHMEEDLEKHMGDLTLECIDDSSMEANDTFDEERTVSALESQQPQPVPTYSTGVEQPIQGVDQQSSSDTSSTTSTSSNGTSGSERIIQTGWSDQSIPHVPMQTPPHSPQSASSTPGSQSSSSGSSTASIPSLMAQPVPPCMVVSVPKLPTVSPDVLRIARHRHQEGLMMPQLFQVLQHGEIKISCSLEDETSRELPSSALLFRLIRQYVYGILFSVQHLNAWKKRLQKPTKYRRQVIVKEWCVRKDSSIQKPDLVEAVALPWPIPPCRQLWLGKSLQDKNIRTRAFLSCMLSDTPGMMKNSYVPRHAIILCTVLRYMLQSKYPVLRRHELDAFLAQSVSPMLNDPNALQDLQIPQIPPRGIQLAAMFMRGVEAALTANDACGAPVPWTNCCPWLYFDGKLFQYKLYRGSQCKNLKEVCDNQMDQVGKVERMRQVIMEGITDNLIFAKPSLPKMMNSSFIGYPMYPPSYRPAGSMPQTRPRSMPGKPVNNRGGKLEIAGVVVSEWAGSRSNMGRGHMQHGYVTGHRRGGYGVVSTGAMRGRTRGGQVGAAGRGRGNNYSRHGAKTVTLWGNQDAANKTDGAKNQGKKKKSTKNGTNDKLKNDVSGVGRGCTIESGEGSIEMSELVKPGSLDTEMSELVKPGSLDMTKHNGDAVDDDCSEETSSTTSTIEEEQEKEIEHSDLLKRVTSDDDTSAGDDIVTAVVSSVVDSIASSVHEEDVYTLPTGNGKEFVNPFTSPDGRPHLQTCVCTDSPDSGVNVDLGRTPEQTL